MKSILGFLILAVCCMTLISTRGYAASAPVARDAEKTAAFISIPVDHPVLHEELSVDPYLGFGELSTSAPLPADCFNGNLACEEIPIGSQCWDGVCRCVAFGYCHKP
jgi:hypothetical protein